jgi:hypothetical protein
VVKDLQSGEVTAVAYKADTGPLAHHATDRVVVAG